MSLSNSSSTGSCFTKTVVVDVAFEAAVLMESLLNEQYKMQPCLMPSLSMGVRVEAGNGLSIVG